MTLSHRLSGGVRTLAALAVAALVLAFLPLLAGVADAAHPENHIDRLSGENRFGTAADIAQDFIDDVAAAEDVDPVDTVIVATGEEFADALAGASIAGFLNAPIVLVASNPDAIPAETEDFLEANPELTNAVILGQTLAVGPAVEARLEADFGLEVARIGGQNRFETAKAIGDYIAAQGGEFGTAPAADGQMLTTAIVATGERFPDALASGPLAFGGIHPILLSPIAIAEPEALAFIAEQDIEQIVIAGGTQAISAEAEATFAAAGVEIIRVNGPIDATTIPASSQAPEGRVSTAVGLAQLTRVVLGNEFDHDAETGAVARGDVFADALVVAPLVGLRGGDLLLSNAPEPAGGDPAAFLSNTTVEAVASGCSGYGDAVHQFIIPGGTLAVSEGQEGLIAALIVCDDFVRSGDLFFDLDPAGDEDEAELLYSEDPSLARELGLAVAVGDEVAVDVIGFAPGGEPTMVRETGTVGAEGAEVTAELFQETDDAVLIAEIEAFLADDTGTVDPPMDENEEPIDFYVETDADGVARYFVKVVGPIVQVLDEDGRTTFDFGAIPAEFEGDHRLFICAPPQELPNPGCTDDVGDDRSDDKFGFIRADIAVGEEDPEARYVFPIDSLQEVGPGTPDGEFDTSIAQGFMILNVYADTVCYGYAITANTADVEELVYSEDEEGAPLPGAHIHEGEAGETGGVVQGLLTPLDHHRAAATCTPTDPALAQDLVDNPDDYYFNLHTEQFPGGLVRGQLPALEVPVE